MTATAVSPARFPTKALPLTSSVSTFERTAASPFSNQTANCQASSISLSMARSPNLAPASLPPAVAKVALASCSEARYPMPGKAASTKFIWLPATRLRDEFARDWGMGWHREKTIPGCESICREQSNRIAGSRPCRGEMMASRAQHEAGIGYLFTIPFPGRDFGGNHFPGRRGCQIGVLVEALA